MVFFNSSTNFGKEQGSQMNKKELKKELKDLLIKEDYEVDEEHFEESVEKVLGFRAFEVSKKNVVRYVPPSERPPKKAPKTK